MKYWSLFSGGKDSTACAEYLSERGELAGVVSFQTGIATPDWLPFIERTVNQRGWNFETYRTPEDYDCLVNVYGFPGAGLHGLFMNYLKGRCVRQFRKHHKGEILASGVRSGESKRRFINTKEWGEFEGVKVWAPIYDWTTEQTWNYVRTKGFERSPAYQALCISGDCLCGAYADPVERAALKAFYPEIWQRIERLEKQVDTKWGMCGRIYDKNQMSLFCADCEAPS